MSDLFCTQCQRVVQGADVDPYCPVCATPLVALAEPRVPIHTEETAD